MRLIDASGFERELIADMSLYGEKISGDEAYSRALLLLAGASTLTPPNEAPPCYRTDSDGCAYQCYDGDDEPIEKCKECPLCYSDKQRHYTPPNEPLTWEELKAETKINPVYSIKYGWIFPSTIKDEPYAQVWFFTSKGFAQTELFYHDTFYRCPPEEEA